MLPLNPLDWPGDWFLLAYAMLAMLLAYGAFALRTPHIPARMDHAPSHPVELGYLSGGWERAGDTVAVGLLAAGAAAMNRTGDRLLVAPGSGCLLRELQPFAGVLSRGRFLHAIAPQLRAVHDRLEQQGLLLDAVHLARVNRRLAWMFGAVALFGAAKIMVGMSSGHSVGALVALVAGVAVAGAWLLNSPTWRTPSGKAALEAARVRHSRAARAPLGPEMALAFALTGPAVLHGTAFDPYRKLIPLQQGWSAPDMDGMSLEGDGGCGGCST